MTIAEAARLLDLPPDSSPEQLETRFLELRAKLEDKIAKAPTPGLKEKYRASLADITTAFEQLTLAADSSDLPVLQRSAPATPTASTPASPSAAPRSDSPAPPKPKPKTSGNREFAIVALIAVFLLGGGGWWVMKIRADNAEKTRVEADVRANQAEQKVRWEALEKELTSAERKLSELKADNRNTKELSAPAVAELQARFAAQGDYVEWLQPYLSRQPAKTQLAKLDAFLSTKAMDDASSLSSELTQGLTKTEQEVASQKKSLLAVTSLVQISSDPSGLLYQGKDAYGRTIQGVTPYTGELPLGTLSLEIFAPNEGWIDYDFKKPVRRGETLSVKAEFGRAVLQVDSSFSGLTYEVTNALGYKKRGSTPAELKDVPAGEVTVNIASPKGWTNFGEKVNLKPGQILPVKAMFGQGTLQMESSFSGLTYEVTNAIGYQKRGSTPFELKDVPSGEVFVKITAPKGWIDFVEKVNVKPGETLPIKALFGTGTLNLTSSFSGRSYEVTNVLGYLKRGSTPFELKDVPSGEAFVKITAPNGWSNFEEKVKVKLGETLPIKAVFATGAINVTSTPTGLSFILSNPEGYEKKGTTPDELSEVPSGPVAVRFSLSDLPQIERTATVLAGGTVAVKAEFVYGSVELTSEPSGAAVWVGEKLIGTTPLNLGEVILGKLKGQLRLKDYQILEFSGEVQSKEILRLALKLKVFEGPKEGRVFTLPGIGLIILPITAGSFTMGSESATARADEKPVHRVTLSKPYWLGNTEVTQGQWETIMGTNPSYFKGANLPVEQVSWDDCMSFCQKVTERERAAGRLPSGYRYTLPTEAQ